MARIAKDLDLVGKRVGRLEVISRAEDRHNIRSDGYNRTRRYWNCKCDCGNFVEVRQDAILSEKTESCGCLRDEVAKEQIKKAHAVGYVRPTEDLTGMVFGRLTVIEAAPRSVTPKGRELARWICSCKCGGSIDVLHDSLKAGKTVTCGCVPPDFIDSEFKNKSEVFIFKARQVHGDKFDYSQTEFKHSQQDIVIVCPQHGAFKQKPSNHLNGNGCAKCSGVFGEKNTFIDIEDIGNCPSHGKYYISEGCISCFEEDSNNRVSEFISKAKEVQSNEYDYSQVFFEKLKDKITIVCQEHGKFIQSVRDHLKGQGCPECGRLSKIIGTNAFIERSIDVHGNRFDYSLVEYEHSNTPVEIICKSHGIFRQKPSAHMNGQKCPKCAGEERALKQHWNYIKRCELNEEFANSDGILYLLEMSHGDETFLKVGISSNFKRRLGHYKEDSLSIKTLKEVKSTAIQTAYWERDILKKIREAGVRYIPEKDFKGWTECAVIESKDYLIKLFEEIESFERC